MNTTRIDRIHEEHVVAQDRISRELFPALVRALPDAEVTLEEHTIGNAIHVKVTDGDKRITFFVSRQDYYGASYHRQNAIRVSLSTSIGFYEEQCMKKNFGGQRLRKDILDEGFDAQKIVNVITSTTDEWKATVERERSYKRSQDERSEQLERLAHDYKVVTGLEWTSNGARIEAKELSIVLHQDPTDESKVSVNLSRSMKKDTALRIIELLKEDN